MEHYADIGIMLLMPIFPLCWFFCLVMSEAPNLSMPLIINRH